MNNLYFQVSSNHQVAFAWRSNNHISLPILTNFRIYNISTYNYWKIDSRAKTVAENLKLNSALLSRFDLVFILLDQPDEVREFIVVCRLIRNKIDYNTHKIDCYFSRKQTLCCPSTCWRCMQALKENVPLNRMHLMSTTQIPVKIVLSGNIRTFIELYTRLYTRLDYSWQYRLAYSCFAFNVFMYSCPLVPVRNEKPKDLNVHARHPEIEYILSFCTYLQS